MFWWWIAVYFGALFTATILDGVFKLQTSDPIPFLFAITFWGFAGTIPGARCTGSLPLKRTVT